jgi:hypothetical protein
MLMNLSLPIIVVSMVLYYGAEAAFAVTKIMV